MPVPHRPLPVEHHLVGSIGRNRLLPVLTSLLLAISLPTAASSDIDALVASLDSPEIRELAAEALARSPELSALQAEVDALTEKAPQVGALPDPMASLTAYPLSPETRVGPQMAMLMISQKLPWLSRLDLREQVALRELAEAQARLESRRLMLFTEVRRLCYELAFLDAEFQAVEEDRATLSHYEELARARYASGFGLEQAVVKLHAELTKDDARLLQIQTRRATLVARINQLRDRSDSAEVPVGPLPRYGSLDLSRKALADRALAHRPEIQMAQERIDRAGLMTQLAQTASRPDFTVGLSYGFVGRRDDIMASASPPEDDGQDVVGLTLGITLPIWRKKIAAGVSEALHRERGAEESRRSVTADISAELEELLHQIPLVEQRIRLLNDVLLLQATQSLQSAESAYASGTLGALDLLDAERVLLDVQVAVARARADYAVVLARLEGVVGTPLEVPLAAEGVR